MRLWALALTGLLVALVGLALISSVAHARVSAVERSVVLADGVDPTLRVVAQIRQSRIAESITSGLSPSGVTIAPFTGQDLNSISGYLDPDSNMVITYEPDTLSRGYLTPSWSLEPYALVTPLGIVLMLSAGMLAAARFSRRHRILEQNP